MQGDASYTSASGTPGALDRVSLSSDVIRGTGALLRASGYSLFFMMLFVPAAYQRLKGALLAVTVVGILLASVATRRFPLAPRIALAALGYSALGLAFVIRGVAGGAPGALTMFNVYVTWPLVYTLLVVGASFPGVLRGLTRVTVYAGIAISLYSMIYVLSAAGFWPSSLYYEFDQGQAIGFHGTHVEFGLYSTATLTFVVPYLVGALFVFPIAHGPLGRPQLWLAMVLSFATVLLSGRRALLLLVPVAPLLALLFRGWLPVTIKRESGRFVRRIWWAGLALVILLIVIMTAVGGMAPRGFVDMVASGFHFNSDLVAMSRRDQFIALVSGWMQHPVFGFGIGAVVPGLPPSSVDMPWSYELTYVAILYQTGIVGFVAYSGGSFWTFIEGRRIARTGWSQAPYLVSTLVGTASFLLANATNPYISRYDSIWVVFFPIAFINAWLIETHRERA